MCVLAALLLLLIPATAFTQTTGPRTMLAMGARWPGHDPPMSDAPANFAVLADSIDSQSRGVMTLAVTILPEVNIPTPSNPSDWSTVLAVYDAARAMGTNPDDYDYRVVILPPISWPYVGSAGTQEFMLNGTTSVGALIHHMKECMGLAHARHYECYQDGLPILFDPSPGACSWQSGDVTSGGTKAPSPPQQEYLGWIEPHEVLQTSLVRLLPYERYPSVVKVRGEYGGRYYYYELALRKGKIEVYLSCWEGNSGWSCTVNGYLGTLIGAFTDPGDFGTEYTVIEATSDHADLLVNLHDIVTTTRPVTWGWLKRKYR